MYNKRKKTREIKTESFLSYSTQLVHVLLGFDHKEATEVQIFVKETDNSASME
jgi:hypothetical protein